MSSSGKENYRKEWRPAVFFEKDASKAVNYIMVVLNVPIENPALLKKLRATARRFIAVDGGANRLFGSAFGIDKPSLSDPDAIIGDFDSITSSVQAYFEARDVPCIKDPDQYSTDLTKCLRYISRSKKTWAREDAERANDGAVQGDPDVLIMGGLGGRADQAFSQLHHLYSASNDPEISCKDMYLMASESIIFLLHKGVNLIHTPPDLLEENVGIIPIGRPAVITTKGLEWDVEKWPTEFGNQMSTSNHIRSSEVLVETTERVLFTVEIAKTLRR